MKIKIKAGKKHQGFWSRFLFIYIVYFFVVMLWLSGSGGYLGEWAMWATLAITIGLIGYLFYSAYLLLARLVKNVLFVFRSKVEVYFTNNRAVVAFRQK